MNNCAYEMRTTRIQSDAKNLLFDCLLHQLGCCCARSLQARSLRSNQAPRQGKFVILFVYTRANKTCQGKLAEGTFSIFNQRDGAGGVVSTTSATTSNPLPTLYCYDITGSNDRGG